MSIGKSKAKIYVENDTKVSFADVAGVEEAKDELKEIVGFLSDPQRFGRLGGRAPKGVLLVGPAEAVCALAASLARTSVLAPVPVPLPRSTGTS
jgi:ATP-dependent Zn protease